MRPLRGTVADGSVLPALPSPLFARWQAARQTKQLTHLEFMAYLLDLHDTAPTRRQVRRARPARTMWT